MKKISIYILLSITLLMNWSCSKDFLYHVPTNQVAKETVLTSIPNLKMAIDGIHRRLFAYTNNGFCGEPTFNLWGDYAGSVFVRSNTSSTWYLEVYRLYDFTNYSSTISSTNYSFRYILIKNCNEIIAAIDDVVPASAAEEKLKQNIKAQAHAYRAYCYYSLGLYFSDAWTPGGANSQLAVPLRVKPDSENMPRATLSEVYAQVLADAKVATDIFEAADDTYKNDEKYNLTEAMVYMLRARLYMTQGEWALARAEADKIFALKRYQIMGYNNYSSGFSNGVRNSNVEWIWGSLITGVNSAGWGSYYAYNSYNYTAPFITASPNMIWDKVYDYIPADDQRKELFLGDSEATIEANGTAYYFNQGWTPNQNSAVYRCISRKFSTATSGADTSGDVVYMRLAEAYYIAAEAAYYMNEEQAAADYLAETILPYNTNYVAPTGAALLEDIKMYKKFDLYGEGRSWEDVKRRGDLVDRTNSNHDEYAASVMQYQRGGVGDEYFKVVIPKSALDNNPLLVP